jgi:hypothetical protein
MSKSETPMPIIQLYSPFSWHSEQAMLLNEEGKQALIEALQSCSKKIAIPAFVQDGEGYMLFIQVLPENEIREYKDPYTWEVNQNLSNQEGKKDPCFAPTKEEYEQLCEGKDAGEWKGDISDAKTHYWNGHGVGLCGESAWVGILV